MTDTSVAEQRLTLQAPVDVVDNLDLEHSYQIQLNNILTSFPYITVSWLHAKYLIDLEPYQQKK